MIAPDVFAEINRVIYHAAPDFDDGQPVTCLGSSTDSSECLRQFVDQRRTFDLIFVDPWHTYESSLRDIQLALTLLVALTGQCFRLATIHDSATATARYNRKSRLDTMRLLFPTSTSKGFVASSRHGTGPAGRRGRAVPRGPSGVQLPRLDDIRDPWSGDYEPGAAGGVSAAPSAPAPISRLALVLARGACGRVELYLCRCVDGVSCVAQAAARQAPPAASSPRGMWMVVSVVLRAPAAIDLVPTKGSARIKGGVRPEESTAETQPQLQPALLRLSAMMSQYFI